MRLRVRTLPSKEYLHRNVVVVSPVTYAGLSEELAARREEEQTKGIVYVKIGGYVFTLKAHDDVKDDEVCIGKYERGFLVANPDSLEREVDVEVFAPTKDMLCGMMELSVGIEGGKLKSKSFVVDCAEVKELVMRAYFNNVFGLGQKILVNGTDPRLELQVIRMQGMNLAQYVGGAATDNQDGVELDFGLLMRETAVVFTKADPQYQFRLVNNRDAAGGMGSNLFKSGFNLNQLGIGGLGEQFANIFRRAFASRIFPPSIIHKLGLQHIKGVLLYGPPGCGKTLMARQIGKMLNSKEPKIVSGPEIMNKYVGQSEENIRNLFAEAESEYKELGDDSDLHIIIFDEIDAICKQRGTASDSTGVHDSVVNQLLAKMDGVEAINNILIIGMTNRKDMIDEALLRPGRFELCIEIQLPDRKGVEEIYRIHMRNMSDNGLLRGICIDDPTQPGPSPQGPSPSEAPVSRQRGTPEDYANFQKLVSMSKNYSGAEIAGVCRCAASYALNRMIQIDNGVVKIGDSTAMGAPQPDAVLVMAEDFFAAVRENPPSFGRKEKQRIGGPVSAPTELGCLASNISSADKLIEYIRNSTSGSCLNVLIEGARGSGKSSIAGYIADKIAQPAEAEGERGSEEQEGGDNAFVRVISAPSFVSHGVLNEYRKADAIIKIFQDAFRVRGGSANVGTIVVDDIDRVVEYTQMGMRYSNVIVQSLKGALEMTESTEDLAKGEQRQSATRVVLCTVDESVVNEVRMLGLTDLFPLHIKLEVPGLEEKKEVLVSQLGDRLDPKFKASLLAEDESSPVGLALGIMSLKQLVFSIDFLKSYPAGGITSEVLIAALSMGG